jgi:hypothetical protein
VVNLFSITIPTNTVTLDAQGRGNAVFNVTNTSGTALTGRASLETVSPNSAFISWLAQSGATERRFEVSGTHRFEGLIQAPPNAHAGEYSFRLNMRDISDPDESFTQGPAVTFLVPEPVKPKPKLPVWAILLILLGGVVLMALLVLVIYLLIPKGAQVPVVIGRPATTAQALVEIAGLAVTQVLADSSDPAGIVFASTPQAGEKLNKGAPVWLFVSSGPTATLTPTFTSTFTSTPTGTRKPTSSPTSTPTRTRTPTRTVTRTATRTPIPPSTKFKIDITTGSRTNSGTDANVFITLFGDVANGSERKLDTPGHDDFERGNTDTFNLVTSQNIGRLTRILIRHDNSGSAPGWFLDKIVITNIETNQKWTFTANRWLATDEGDGAISIFLAPD